MKRASVWPPVVVSALALTALNLVVASLIARVLTPSASVLPSTALAALLALAVVLAACAIWLWRRFARGGAPASG